MPDGSKPSDIRTRTYEYSVKTFDIAAARELTGLEYMRSLLSGDIGAKPSISDTMNMSVPVHLDFGEAAFLADPADFLLNPLGTVHGGFAATLLDSALGCAIHTALPKATGYTTAELSVNYTRAIRPDSGRLRAEGKGFHVGRQMATAEARLIGEEDGKLYAHGKTTCFVFPLPPAKG